MNIQILKDENCEMVKIQKDGKSVFEGNYWDLPTSPNGLASLLERLGINVEIKPYKYE